MEKAKDEKKTIETKEKKDTIKLKYVSKGNFKKFGTKWTTGITRSVARDEAIVLLGVFPNRFKKVKN